ncbi:MAG: anti-anti-sigma factor [Pseudonocardia sp.]|nr:anti-anti-sigma factor [Pseudonocardia sp.]
MTNSEASTSASAAGANEAMLQLDALELIPGIRVMSVRGELDILTSPALVKRICLELAAGPRGLILDLSHVAFLGSSGISALLQTRDAAFRSNVPLRLVCPSRSVLRPLEATGVAGLFAISTTLSEALSYHNVDMR